MRLPARHWEPFNRARLENLAQRFGSRSSRYDPACPPYAVFDWDNTCVFLDTEEAVFAYHLENLRLGCTPEQLSNALRQGVPVDDFQPPFHNAAGQPVNIEAIACDIDEAYHYLYDQYRGLAGYQPLDQIRHSPHYANFVAKFRYLYDALDGSFGAVVSYPWLTFRFAGMTAGSVRGLAQDAIDWQLSQPIGRVTWRSSPELPGRAGVVSASAKHGLRLLPEMQDLFHLFRSQGIDIWICTASFVEVVREMSSNPKYGFCNPPERVLGMELERDSRGALRAQYRSGYHPTHHAGKTLNVRQFLVERYGYGPVFVAGDSEGDQNMMQDFPDTRLVLIVNLLRRQASDVGRFSNEAVRTHGQPDAHYLLQGRDDNLGRFRRSQATIPLGSSRGRLLGS